MYILPSLQHPVILSVRYRYQSITQTIIDQLTILNNFPGGNPPYAEIVADPVSDKNPQQPNANELVVTSEKTSILQQIATKPLLKNEYHYYIHY